jgi:F-type H+-transporting ATPase subunit delta
MASSTRQARANLFSETATAVAEANLRVAEELLVSGFLLGGSPQLRNSLLDPSMSGDAKRKLVDMVFGVKMSKETVELLLSIVTKNWSTARDMATSAEMLGVRVVAVIVSKAKTTESLLSELFAIQKALDSNSELQLALSSTQASLESKQKLVSSIFAGKLSAEANLLLEQAVSSRSHKHATDVMGDYADWIAGFANESVAEVRVAKPLSVQQLDRLEKALGGQFGRNLSINVVIDPSLVGGLRVSVGGEVLDATVQSKITQARLQLA